MTPPIARGTGACEGKEGEQMRIIRFSDKNFPGITGLVIEKGKKRKLYYAPGGSWTTDWANARLYSYQDDAQDALDSEARWKREREAAIEDSL